MSIKSIAEEAGVSISTVSRVLNNPMYKPSDPSLRSRIWRIAINMNYTPNQAARNLRSGRKSEKTYYINILMARTNAANADPFFTEILHVLESEIHKKSAILSNVWYMPVFSDDKKCRHINLNDLIDEMEEDSEIPADGLIVIGRCNQKALGLLKKRYRNVVSINRNSTNYTVDEVTCDGKKIARIALDYLCGLGHTEIGYVGNCFNESRYLGYSEALQQHGLDLIPSYIIDTDQTEIAGYHAMEHFMKSEDKPTAIYCANDITAVGMLHYLESRKNNYYRPSIISSDDIEAAQNTKPMLTTVRLPKDEMGKMAITLLMDRITGGHESVIRLELEGKLMVRTSCASAEESMWSDYCI